MLLVAHMGSLRRPVCNHSMILRVQVLLRWSSLCITRQTFFGSSSEPTGLQAGKGRLVYDLHWSRQFVCTRFTANRQSIRFLDRIYARLFLSRTPNRSDFASIRTCRDETHHSNRRSQGCTTVLQLDLQSPTESPNILRPLMCTILANPDVAGIGVRISIYTQSFLVLVQTIWPLILRPWDMADRRKIAQANILLIVTGCALLFAAAMQIKFGGLSQYHALIILNLNWLIAVTGAQYFILVISFAGGSPKRSHKHDNVAIFFRAIHLSGMSALGIRLYVDVSAPSLVFDTSTANCTATTVYNLFWKNIQVTNHAFRNAWLVIYMFTAIPLINTFFVVLLSTAPAFLLIGVGVMMKKVYRTGGSEENSSIHRPWSKVNTVGLVFITPSILLLVVFVVSTEMTIARNNVSPGEQTPWTFGQTLSLCLVGFPLAVSWNDYKDMWTKRRNSTIGVADKTQGGETSHNTTGPGNVTPSGYTTVAAADAA